MKIRVILGIAVYAVGLVASRAWAAAAGADILMVPLSPRAVALGGAAVAMTRDIDALLVNPAGLSAVKQFQVNAVYQSGLIDSTQYLALAGPIKAGGVAGVSLTYRGLPPIDNQGAMDGTVKVQDIVAAVTYAYGFQLQPKTDPELGAALTFKWLKSVLGDFDGSTVAFDLSAWWKPHSSPSLSLGLVLKNMGPPLSYIEEADPLPMSANLGAAYQVLTGKQHALQLGLAVDVPMDSNLLAAGVGAEYWFDQILAVRMGYHYEKDSLASTVYGGLGGQFQVNNLMFKIDYALSPVQFSQDLLEFEHTVALTMEF